MTAPQLPLGPIPLCLCSSAWWIEANGLSVAVKKRSEYTAGGSSFCSECQRRSWLCVQSGTLYGGVISASQDVGMEGISRQAEESDCLWWELPLCGKYAHFPNSMNEVTVCWNASVSTQKPVLLPLLWPSNFLWTTTVGLLVASQENIHLYLLYYFEVIGRNSPHLTGPKRTAWQRGTGPESFERKIKMLQKFSGFWFFQSIKSNTAFFIF